MTTTHRRLTAAAALLLAALALAHLAAPAHARSLQGKRKQSQAEREAQQLADQVAAQEALVAGAAERDQEALDRQAEAQYGSGWRKRRGGGASDDDDSSDGGSSYDSSSRKDRKDRKRRHDDGEQEQEQERRRGGKKKGRKQRGDGGDGGGVAAASASADGDWGKADREGRGGKGVPATYHYYSPAYETSSLYCADAFRNRSGRDLLKRPWMAYCAHGGMSQDKCGRCARVTNLRTGASVVMLVVDMCGTGGVDMDPIGFNQIDTDGAGVRDGRMEVSVDFCSC